MNRLLMRFGVGQGGAVRYRAEDGCFYIHGHPRAGGSWRYCGDKRVEGKPYCPAHCVVCYVQRPPKGEEPDANQE